MASESATARAQAPIPEISRAELMRRLRDPSLIIIDARSPALYADEHLPRALNLPHDGVIARAAELLPERNAEIAVYCSSFT